jgi:hypothetical protein
MKVIGFLHFRSGNTKLMVEISVLAKTAKSVSIEGI